MLADWKCLEDGMTPDFSARPYCDHRRAVGGGLFFRCLAPKFCYKGGSLVVSLWAGMKDIWVDSSIRVEYVEDMRRKSLAAAGSS